MSFVLSVLVAITNVFGVQPPAPLAYAAEDCGCSKGQVGLKLNFGRFRGQCVDDCKYRATKLLKQSQGHFVVAHVLHQRRFWTAQIPRQPTEVDMAFEEFIPSVSHVFLRLRFTEPIQLRAEDGSKERTTIKDLVISSEGVPPKGQAYDLMESSLGNYLLAHRVISVDEAARHMVHDLKHSVRLFRLRLNDSDKRRALERALKASAEKTFASIYNLLTNNCATSAFAVLDPNLQNPERAIPVTLSMGTLRALDEAGLWERTKVLPNLEVELQP